jgi:hypothetical protein
MMFLLCLIDAHMSVLGSEFPPASGYCDNVSTKNQCSILTMRFGYGGNYAALQSDGEHASCPKSDLFHNLARKVRWYV